MRGFYILMSNLGMDLFDPRSAVMDSDLISSPTRGPDPDLTSPSTSNFSDRFLQIEIFSYSQAASEVCQTLADWAATRKNKHHRVDIVKKYAVVGGSTAIKALQKLQEYRITTWPNSSNEYRKRTDSD